MSDNDASDQQQQSNIADPQPPAKRPNAKKAAAHKVEADAIAAAKPHRPPNWWGVVTGLVAAAVGLSIGEVVAGFSRVLRPPVENVGDRVIDHVPRWLKEFAVRNFGTSDKTVLIWTILVVIAIAAAIVGVATVRGRRDIGVGFAILFGILGAWSGGVGRNTHFIGIFPSIFAAAAAGCVLLYGYHLTQPKKSKTPQRARAAVATSPVAPSLDRRRFLTNTGGLVVGAVFLTSIGRNLQDRFATSLERAGVRLPTPKKPLPSPPTDPALDTANVGLSTLITPISDFYRIDTALSFPSISLQTWKLKITGMVDKELTFTYDDLLNRDLIERDITMSCVSNEVGGSLVGNARWVGCRLDDLLHEAGVQPDADEVLGVSVDGFTAGFPVSVLDGRDALVVVGMNGEALPVKNGFPARIVVPGLYGYVSAVKWLSEIKLTRFDRDSGYWIPLGWSELGPIKTQSRIDRPGFTPTAGNIHIAGVAWAPTRGISKVEVQVDDSPWMEATLGPTLGDNTWRQWWVKWDATVGKHQLRVRATDGTGATQPEQRTDVAPNGASGWHTLRVTVKAP